MSVATVMFHALIKSIIVSFLKSLPTSSVDTPDAQNNGDGGSRGHASKIYFGTNDES